MQTQKTRHYTPSYTPSKTRLTLCCLIKHWKCRPPRRQSQRQCPEWPVQSVFSHKYHIHLSSICKMKLQYIDDTHHPNMQDHSPRQNMPGINVGCKGVQKLLENVNPKKHPVLIMSILKLADRRSFQSLQFYFRNPSTKVDYPPA